jgi:hypothetical protein
MTEKEANARDMFFRQGILGPGKVPFIMAGSGRSDVIRSLAENADADIFKVGEMKLGIPEAQTEEDLQKMPWAIRGLSCSSELSQFCNDNYRYIGHCWFERDDFTPPSPQGGVGGRAKVKT